MGFKRERKTYKLAFTGELDGLIVRARSLPLGQFMELGKLMDTEAAVTPGADDMGKVDTLFRTFAGALMSWNLEDDDDKPVPANVDGLYSQDLELCTAVVTAYIHAVSGVAAPLDQPSPDGDPSLEASMPMEVS